MRMIIASIITWVAFGLAPTTLHAGEAPNGAQIFADRDSYISAAFEGEPALPNADTVWPSGNLRDELTAILGHKPALRFKYWGTAGKTVWILDEIGKDRPITAGVVINRGKIEDVQVLVFRESRGWEIKYDFFTKQFANLWLKPSHDLSDKVDNITGATLSVKAMTRMAKAALLLHEHSSEATQNLAHAN